MLFLVRFCLNYEVIRTFANASHLNFFKLPQISQIGFKYLVLILVLVAILILQALKYVRDIPKLKMLRKFFIHDLQQSTDFHELKLEDLFEKITHLQREHRISSESLDAHHIVMRIMRVENFMIAFFDNFSSLFPLSIDLKNAKFPLSKSLEWLLTFTFVGFLTDSQQRIRKKFQKPFYKSSLSSELNVRLKIVAILALILMPLILFYQILFFVLKYGEELYRKPSQLSNRAFAPIVKWKMREFNELDSQFDERIIRSTKMSTEYLESFYDLRVVILGKIIAFISASMILLLGVLSFLSAEHLKGKMFWLIGILGMILATAKSAIVQDKLDDKKSPTLLLNEIYSNTHYLPNDWKNEKEQERTRKAFAKFFELKIILLFYEMVGIILAPVTLYQFATKHSHEFASFFLRSTTTVKSIGVLCKFSLMNIAIDNMEKNVSIGKEKFDAKLEKSFVNFKLNYPSWISPSTCPSALLDRYKLLEGAKNEFPSLIIASRYQSTKESKDSNSISSSFNDNNKFTNILREFYDTNVLLDRKV